MSHMPDLSRKKQQEVYRYPGPLLFLIIIIRKLLIFLLLIGTQVEVWKNKNVVGECFHSIF